MTLTIEEVRQALPVHLKSAATDNLVDALNTIPLDPEAAEAIRDNFISYTSVLREPRFKIEEYMNAIAYVTFKMMGYNNQESYARTFPDRYQNLIAKGTSGKDISSYVSAYNKGKLVTAVLEQAMIPVWLLNADNLQKAINHQVYLMSNAKSEMVQMQAANSIITHLKRPESKDININMGAVEDKGVEELRNMMTNLAKQQQDLIKSGVATKEIAHQSIVIEGVAVESKEDEEES